MTGQQLLAGGAAHVPCAVSQGACCMYVQCTTSSISANRVTSVSRTACEGVEAERVMYQHTEECVIGLGLFETLQHASDSVWQWRGVVLTARRVRHWLAAGNLSCLSWPQLHHALHQCCASNTPSWQHMSVGASACNMWVCQFVACSFQFCVWCFFISIGLPQQASGWAAGPRWQHCHACPV